MNQEIVRGHYYGDVVRVIFVVAGIAMMVMYPFFSPILKLPVFLPILTVLVLAVLGGFLNPKQTWTILVNTIISLAACAVFQYYAVNAYLHLSPEVSTNIVFFWANQILALLFFVATYLSVKTLRAKILVSGENPEYNSGL